jgi:hypothetical protein
VPPLTDSRECRRAERAEQAAVSAKGRKIGSLSSGFACSKIFDSVSSYLADFIRIVERG